MDMGWYILINPQIIIAIFLWAEKGDFPFFHPNVYAKAFYKEDLALFFLISVGIFLLGSHVIQLLLWAILYMLLYGGMLITLYILNLVARVG
jgi:hypothetical protein